MTIISPRLHKKMFIYKLAFRMCKDGTDNNVRSREFMNMGAEFSILEKFLNIYTLCYYIIWGKIYIILNI